MSIFNHYYSRGYKIEKSADGKHKVPTSLSEGSGYSTIGCSLGLKNTIIDLLESSSCINFDESKPNTTSLYFYPRFSDIKGQRFALLGQGTTHPEGNFADVRASYFVHNSIIGMADLKSILAARKPELILCRNFKDTYTDGKNGYRENELSYQSCIDSPLELSEYSQQINTNLNFSSASISYDFARSLVVNLSRANSHCAILMNSNGSIDRDARYILWKLYMWLPQKLLQNLGFITCLNSAKAHKTCNLMFCSAEEYREIEAHGIGEIRPNSIIFIDPSHTEIKSDAISGYNQDDIEYINWLAKCISGGASVQDESIRSKLDEQELLIDKRQVPFGLLSKLFKLITCQHTNKTSPGESSSRALGIAAFALLNVTASSVPDSVDHLMPLISSELDKTILSGDTDALIIDIDNKYPGLIEKLTPYLSSEVNEGINDIRIYKSSLSSLRNMCNASTPGKNISRIIEGAKIKYREKAYDISEITYGYEIGLFALKKSNWDDEIKRSCKELFNRTFEVCSTQNTKIFSAVNSIETFLEALAAIRIAYDRITVKDCEHIVSDIASASREQPYNVMRRLIQNTRSIPNAEESSQLILATLTYICKLCITTNYETQILVAFCKFLEPKEKYADIWQNVIDLSAQVFISSVAKGADSFKTLQGTLAVISAAPNNYVFVKKIASALTILITSRPANENAQSRNLKDFRGLISTVCDAIFKNCSENNLSEPAQDVKNTICTRTIESIDKFALSSVVAERYQQTPIRERATILESVCTKIAKLKELKAFEAFKKNLGIPPYPEYVKSGGVEGVIENVYKAFYGDEDRQEYINARIRDMRNSCDFETFGMFSNNVSAKGDAIAKIIEKKGTDSDLFQAFSSALQQMYDGKISVIESQGLTYTTRWCRYIPVLTNGLLYNLGTILHIGDISESDLLTSDRGSNCECSIGEICKQYNIAKSCLEDLSNHGSSLYNELVRVTASARRYLDDKIYSDEIRLNPYTEIAQLVSNNLIDLALVLFPRAVESMLDQIETGENKSRSAINTLSARLYQGKDAAYCNDSDVNYRLEAFLKKHPHSNTGKWVGAVASIAIIAALSIIIPILVKGKPVDVELPQVWAFQPVSNSDYIEYISPEIKNGEISNVYRLIPKEVSAEDESVDSDTSDSDHIRMIENDCFGSGTQYARIVISYESTISSNSDASLKALSTEELSVPLSGSDLYIDASRLSQQKINSGCNIYVAQVTNWTPIAQVNEGNYPTLEDALNFSEGAISSTDASNADISSALTKDILLLESVEVNNTLQIEENISISAVEENLCLYRGSSFAKELFSINENASLVLDNVTLDGGAEWEDYVPDENEESVLPDSGLKFSFLNNKIYFSGKENKCAELAITNDQKCNISSFSFDVKYDPDKISISEEVSSSDIFDVITSDNGIIRFSFPKKDKVAIIEPGKTVNVPIEFTPTESYYSVGTSICVVNAEATNLMEVSETDSQPDIACSIGTLPSVEIIACSANSLKTIVPVVNDKESEFLECFSPNNRDYTLLVPYDVEKINFMCEAFINDANISITAPDGFLNVDQEVEYTITVTSTAEEGAEVSVPEDYLIHVKRMKRFDGSQQNLIVHNSQNIGLCADAPIVVNYGNMQLCNSSVIQNNCIVGSNKDTAGALINYGTAQVFGIVRHNYAINSESKYYCGGILNCGKLVLSDDGCVCNNIASGDESVGGVLNTSTGDFVIDNGKIDSNNADAVGGLLNLGTLQIKGGFITNNTAQIVGGVQNDNAHSLSISGLTIISQNIMSTTNTPSNLSTKKQMIISDNISGSVIGLANSDELLTFAEADGRRIKDVALFSTCFFSDATESFSIKISENGRALYFDRDEPSNYYRLSTSCGENGSISYSGTRNLGEYQTWTLLICPDDGYIIGNVLEKDADGNLTDISNHAVPIPDDDSNCYSIDFSNVSEDTSVEVLFSPETECHVITSYDAAGGSVIPKDINGTEIGADTIIAGGSKISLFIVVNNGYKLTGFTINNEDLLPQLSSTDGNYTLKDFYVTEDLVVVASFSQTEVDAQETQGSSEHEESSHFAPVGLFA